MWAKQPRGKWLNRSCGKAGKTANLWLRKPASHHRALLLWCHSLLVCSVVGTPGVAPCVQTAPSVLHVVREKLRKKSASPGSQHVSSISSWVGHLFSSLHGHLHLQYVSSQEETQICKFIESLPTLTQLLVPSLLLPFFFSAGLLWHNGAEPQRHSDGSFGLTIMVTNQKREGASEELSHT